MGQDADDIAETEWRDAFRERLREAQGDFTDRAMAEILGISHDRYRKYVSGGPNRKTILPLRHLPKFCLVTKKDIFWLISGDTAIRAKKPMKAPTKKVAARRHA